MKILITGVGGYIGNQLAYYLSSKLNDPIELYGYDKHPENVIHRNLFNVVWNTDCRSHQLMKAIRYDYVFHLAGSSSVPIFNVDPHLAYLNTVKVNELVGGLRCDNFVMVSSASVYVSDSHYAISKLMSEEYFNLKRFNTNVYTYRLQNVAGHIPLCDAVEDHDPETHLIPNLVSNKPLTINGNPEIVRDYVHVYDVCRALASVIPNQFPVDRLLGPVCGKPWYIGTGVGSSIYDVLKAYYRVTGVKKKIIMGDVRVGDPLYQINDRASLPYMKNLDDIITDTIEGYKRNRCISPLTVA